MYTYENHHRHSMWTNPRISDCTVSNADYAARAIELGQRVLSTCEHGWQGNVWDAYKTAQANGLKMMVAAEAYWVKDRFEKDSSNCHIFLAAKNERGRRALNQALSEANLSGFYGRPRLDVPLMLALPPEDIWVTTACVAGWKYDDVEEIWAKFAEHFGKNFFFEVQYHDTDSQAALNARILKLRDELKVPLIMGCDSHYIKPEEAQIRIDFLESKGLKYPDEEGWYMDVPDGDTAYNRFAKQGVLSHDQIVEAIGNTHVFADVEEYDCPIFNTEIKMPTMYPDWNQKQRNAEYQRLVWSGWDNYKTEVPEEKWPHYEQEIQNEIQVVLDTNMADYFINNYHIMKRGKENGGWLTKTGRGSAVSFITNKLLGFTEVDRIAASVQMYPDRFMSTERILQAGTLPDIDFNIADPEPFAKAQQEILGEDHARPMLAFGTYKTSAAWKLYAKSQGIPFEVANEISNQIKKYENAVKHAEEDEKDDLDPFDYIQPQYRETFLKSKDYLGLITSWSIAPCSYLLYQGNISEEIGLVRIKDKICAALDGHWGEEAHFLKNDLLTVQVVNLIYQAFHRVNMEPPSVNELLSWCSNDSKPWELYRKGCTLCLNQVEQPGTSSRVSTYAPKNISELCAFVAAIRPGFKSMYKIFESREPFKYGVKAFDDLIQTPEMPNSFVLYQEQEMAALNYAGIPMADCYTAIKNIAKKRVEKVLAYKEKFMAGFKTAMMEHDGASEEEAIATTQKLWQIMEDSASYSFNASHAYCVALDSLYEAWLKAHHPLEFYEVAIKIYDKKGNKDKMNALKDEAENYFGIRFLPLRYGQDNRALIADPEHNSILNVMSSIKGFGSSVGKVMYQCGQENPWPCDFIDVLRWLDRHGIKSSKVVPLVKIDYFQDFGNNPELLRIIDFFDFFDQGQAKSIKKDKLNPQLTEIVEKYATDKGVKGNELKSFTITDMDGLLREIESVVRNLHLPELPYRVRAENQKEILGYVDLTTGREEDRRKLFILDIYGLRNKWNPNAKEPWLYKVTTKSIGSGKTATLSVRPGLIKRKNIVKGDIITAPKLQKDPKWGWNLLDYEILV